MSTRAIVLIKNEDNIVHQYYHHFDGYLKGVGKELLSLLEKHNSSKLDHDSIFQDLSKTGNGYSFEGVFSDGEPKPPLHADVDYIYYIPNITKNEVFFIQVFTYAGNSYPEGKDLVQLYSNILNESVSFQIIVPNYT